jgi:CheY-like chemotaxis protein
VALVKLMCETLEGEGFRIYSVSNGKDALKLVQEIEFEAIILDIALKGALNGWDVLDALRANVKTINIPVIISSVYENKGKAMSKDVSEYLVKPFRSNQLIETIKRVMDLDTEANMVVDNDENLQKYILSMLKIK